MLKKDCASTAGGMGLIPAQATKISHAAGRGQKKKENKKKQVKMRGEHLDPSIFTVA